MTLFPNFREFYQRALIVIGESDRLSVIEKMATTENVSICTHWLFALEGNEDNPLSGKYNWKVVVYPANMKGSFDYYNPYIVSTVYKSFDEAVEYTKTLEKLAKEDQLGNSLSIAN